jgi:hypothetical protein
MNINMVHQNHRGKSPPVKDPEHLRPMSSSVEKKVG